MGYFIAGLMIVFHFATVMCPASQVADANYKMSIHSKNKVIGTLDILLRKNTDGYALEGRTSIIADVNSKSEQVPNSSSSPKTPQSESSSIKVVTDNEFELMKIDLLSPKKNKILLKKNGRYYEVKSTYRTTNLVNGAFPSGSVRVKEKTTDFKLLAAKKYIPKMMLPFYIQSNFKSIKEGALKDIPIVVENSLEFKSVRIVYLGSRVINSQKQERFELLAPLRVIYAFDEDQRLISIDDMRRRRKYATSTIR